VTRNIYNGDAVKLLVS